MFFVKRLPPGCLRQRTRRTSPKMMKLCSMMIDIGNSQPQYSVVCFNEHLSPMTTVARQPRGPVKSLRFSVSTIQQNTKLSHMQRKALSVGLFIHYLFRYSLLVFVKPPYFLDNPRQVAKFRFEILRRCHKSIKTFAINP